MKYTKKLSAIALSFALILPVHANTPDQELLEMQQAWANSVYRISDKKMKYQQLQQLSLKANKLSRKHPKNAKLMTWDAIILSTFAGVKGGMGGLSLAKEARSKLEKAQAIDPDVLNGSIYTSLGTLYSKVPSWPLGFGNDQKAEQYFQKALKVNPKGIDPNYFYAEFLAERDKEDQAIAYLEKAIKAPARVNRPLADAGRKKEAQQLLAKLQ